MVIYVDLLIITTLVVNYAFLKTIAIIFNEKLNIIRVIASLLLSIVSLLLYLLPYQLYFSIRYIVGIFIGYIAFNKTTIKEKIIKIIIYYFLNLAFIGTLFIFNVKSIWLMLLSLLYIIIMYLLQSYQKDQYSLIVKINDKRLNAYLDTGNFATYFGIPIVFIKTLYKDENYKICTTTNIFGINIKQDVDIYIGPCINVKGKEYNVYYAFIDDIPYDVILNHQMIKGG